MQYNAVNYKYVFELLIMNVDLFIIEEKLPKSMSDTGHVLKKKYDIKSPYLYWYTLVFTILSSYAGNLKNNDCSRRRISRTNIFFKVFK